MFDFLPNKPIPRDEAEEIQSKVWSLIGGLRKSRPLPRTLYHYTDAAGLKGIVETGVLRATHIAFMNDASEYLHAVSLLLEKVRAARRVVTSSLQKKFLEEVESPIDQTRPEHVAPYFVTCFSAEENSLNQWRAYSRGEGGYCIGFDTAALDEEVLRHNSFLSPAIYNRDEQAAVVDTLLFWALAEYERTAFRYTGPAQDEHRQAWGHRLLWEATAAAPIMKNPAFVEEREWRLIHLLQSKSNVRFLPKPSGLVPFVNLALGAPQSEDTTQAEQGRNLPDRLPITVLWSGPGRATDISLLAGRTLLEQMNYSDVRLEASAIPYRVG